MILVQSGDDARRVAEALATATVVGLDTEYGGDYLPKRKKGGRRNLNMQKVELTGISLAWRGPDGAGKAYIPVGHLVGINVPRAVVERILAAIPRTVRLWVHGAVFDILSLRRWGVSLPALAKLADSAVAAWLLSSDRPEGFKLKKLRVTILGKEPRPDFQGTFSNEQVRTFLPSVAAQYAADDAEDALDLGETLLPDLEAAGLLDTFWNLEMPLSELEADMQDAGMPFDAAAVMALKERIVPRLREVEDEFLWLVGASVTKPQKLAKWGFWQGHWPRTLEKVGKNGVPSVGADVLERVALSNQSDEDGKRAARLRLEFMESAKVRDTYCDPLAALAACYDDGHLHPTLSHVGPRTGRWSCSDPNLQNIPKHGKLAEAIRMAFRAPEGWELVAADQSQVELRILAHLVGGKGALADAMRAGEDLHAATGQAIGMGRPEGKTCNFAIVFGARERKLMQSLGCDYETAKHILKLLHDRMPEVAEAKAAAVRIASSRGYVRTLSGRRRPVRELRSHDKAVRWRGERIAFNTPIQGGARDVIARWLLLANAELVLRGMAAYIVMTIHDEIIVLAPREEVELVGSILKATGEAAWPGLRVPLVVEVKRGEAWGAMRGFEPPPLDAAPAAA